PSDLRILNPVTGTSTLIGATGIAGPVSGLAYDPVSGILYGIKGGSQSTNNFVKLDLNTGTATTLFSTNFAGSSLAYGPDGKLHAGATVGQLSRCDVGPTPVVTPVGTPGLGVAVSGLAIRTPSSASVQVVVDPAISLAPSALPADTVGVAYSQTITA